MAQTFTAREHTITTGFGEWTWSGTGGTGKRTWYLDASQDVTSADADAAYAASPFQVGDPLSTGDTTRYCTKVTIKAIAGDRRGLYGEAEFGPNQFQQNPLLRPDQVSLEVGGETESWFLDDDDKPTVNSAGEIFDKIPPRTTGGVKLVITGNRSTLPAAALVGLSRPNTTNSGGISVRGISIGDGEAKLVGCSGSSQTENGVEFYSVRWELALAPSWEIDIDDRGFNEKDATTGKLKPIYVAGQPTQLPFPLDGNGVAKADPSQTPAKIHFKPYPKDSFNFGWTA